MNCICHVHLILNDMTDFVVLLHIFIVLLLVLYIENFYVHISDVSSHIQ